MKADFSAMDGLRNMPVETLVRHAITGIEAGNTDVRPGLGKVLNIACRVASNVVFNQMSKAAGS